MSDEWASEQAVRPVASLLVDPEDFPFLDQIAGHDDTEFLSMADAFREILGQATSFEEVEGSRIAVRLGWSDSVETTYVEWAVLADRHIPVVEHHIAGTGLGRTLTLGGPEAWLRGVRGLLEEVLGDKSEP